MLQRGLAFALLLLLCAVPFAPAISAQALTTDEVFAADPPWGAQPDQIAWSPDGRSFVYVLPTQDPAAALSLHQYDTVRNQDRVLIDPASYGKQANTPASVVWSPDSKSLCFVENKTLYVRDLATNLDRAIDKAAEDPQWAPDSGALAYVKNGDLYVAELNPKLDIRRITPGGSDAISNGGLDWVYPEELGTQHGFAWSPDGRSIAYLRMDEREVTEFPIVDFLKTDNSVAPDRYPLAGERNPKVSLRVADLGDDRDRLVYDAGSRDEYLPFFGWKPKSGLLLAETLDRAQKQLRVLAFSDARGEPETIYSQDDAKWVGAVEGNGDVQLPTWVPDGSSLWILDRDGVTGLYRRSASGELTRLTGRYRTFSLLGVDRAGAYAYVDAAYPTRRDDSMLRIPVNGGSPVNTTPAAGWHRVSLSPTTALFVDQHSTLNDPPQTDLVETGSLGLRTTLASANAQLRTRLLHTEMLSVDSTYGALDATMLKPPGFDPAHMYPVIVYVYGGPAAPTTANIFGGQRQLYHQLLAQQGFIVFSIDGPASQVDNDAHVQLLYHNFGPGSLAGQEIGARYLRNLPFVDPSRIGIWGWSFGGYETVFALTHSQYFKAGAAVAPVTDWHYYDTIYTERYMGMPQENSKAYDDSSVVRAAANLHGDLLISHGTADDNVHMANTIELLQGFIDAGKTNVDFYVYPRRTHSIAGLAQRRHLYEHMMDWWMRHL